MTYLSLKQAASLVQVKEATVRDWAKQPKNGLIAARLCSERKLIKIGRQEDFPGGAPIRICARSLARFCLRRERESSWDTSPIEEPTEEQITARAHRFLADLAFLEALEKATEKPNVEMAALLAVVRAAASGMAEANGEGVS